MPGRLFVEEEGGRVQVAWQATGQLRAEGGDPEPFESPLSDEDLEDLRWYLEDYLRAPYAVYEDRGKEIEERLPGWGERLFESVFGKDREGGKTYQRAAGKDDWELWVASESPELLSLPWELLRDPDRPTPLALDISGIHRTVGTPQDAVDAPSGEALRVLMVIARPYGLKDVPYRTIARPLLKRLEPVQGRVDLEVLRPPIFHALKDRLRRAKEEGEPFQILHFDGHGSFGGGVQGGAPDRHRYAKEAAEGVLLFETESGDEEEVGAGDLAPVLKGAEIPLLVLNACQSAMLSGAAPEAAVATRLLQEGAAAVVAMGHSVYAVAAAEFMAAFYESLFAGDPVTRAVTAGRRQLRRQDLRPSPKGKLPLADWIVPVHYARREVAFPGLQRQETRGTLSLEEALETIRERDQAAVRPEGERIHVEGDIEAAEGRFFGRDREFQWLETALRTHHVAILHGVGGTGKTELAKAFARWLRDSGGLSPEDASEYAEALLQGRPEAIERRKERAYADLMEYLGGHPLSLRLILPRLEEEAPAELLETLKGEKPFDLGDADKEGRLESLDSCIHYSFRQLSEEDRRRLPALTLFEGVADVNVLAQISSQEEAPERFHGVGLDQWQETFHLCATIGLLTKLGALVYRIHPALPRYLRSVCQGGAGDALSDEQEAAARANIRAHARLGIWLDAEIATGRADTALAVLELERRSFGALAATALERGIYAEAQSILLPLKKLWQARGYLEEAQGWTDRCRKALQGPRGEPPNLETDAGALWLFMVGAEASRLLDAGRLAEAEVAYQAIRRSLEDAAGENADRRLSAAYHELGRVAQARRDLSSAESWYQRALETYEDLGDRPHLGAVYHQLGIVAQARGDLSSAESWYRRSLEIRESVGDRPGMALAYGQLGLLEERRGQHSGALEWTVRCVSLFTEFPHPSTGPGPGHLARLTGELGWEALEAAWRKLTGEELPDRVREWVRKRLEE